MVREWSCEDFCGRSHQDEENEKEWNERGRGKMHICVCRGK